MRIFKRLEAAVLAAALALSLVVLPASAAPGSFTDVSDPNTALNADILRLMGVVSGTGENRFNPSGSLTRAQFCTMVVTFLQRGDEAPPWSPAWGTVVSSPMTILQWRRRLPSSFVRWGTPARRRGLCGPRATWTWPPPPA